jgi:hypothetical protein
MKKNQNAKIQNSFKKFKKIVESKLGKIDWKRVGIYSLAILLYAAALGLLGIKAKLIAKQIIRFSAFA